MRLKYRVWDKENNCWFVPTHGAYKGNLEELLLQPNGDLILRYMEKGQIKTVHESTFPDRFEVNWFAGLHDKKGIEIHGKDLMCSTENPTKDSIIGVVQFGYGEYTENVGPWGEYNDDHEYYGWHCFPLSYCRDTYMAFIKGEYYIVGNVYENPELVHDEEEILRRGL